MLSFILAAAQAVAAVAGAGSVLSVNQPMIVDPRQDEREAAEAALIRDPVAYCSGIWYAELLLERAKVEDADRIRIIYPRFVGADASLEIVCVRPPWAHREEREHDLVDTAPWAPISVGPATGWTVDDAAPR
jgi:hypothetical protein